MNDAVRLAVGTFTILRVGPPQQINRRTARRAMLLAPLVGLFIGIVAELAALATRWLVIGNSDRLLMAVAVVGVIVVMTRGLHLDGLADTSDALGSAKPAAGALEVMRRSDIGPFGVVAVVLVLFAEIAAVFTAISLGRGTLAVVGGAVVARLAIAWACRNGVRAARPNGLGATVADSVPVWALAVATVSVAALLTSMVWIDDDISHGFAVNALVALLTAVLLSQLFVRHCVQRFGGITGDVLGATCEISFLAFVVVVCFR